MYRLRGEEVRCHGYVRALIAVMGVKGWRSDFGVFGVETYLFTPTRAAGIRNHVSNIATYRQHSTGTSDRTPACCALFIPIPSLWFFFLLRRPISALL